MALHRAVCGVLDGALHAPARISVLPSLRSWAAVTQMRSVWEEAPLTEEVAGRNFYDSTVERVRPRRDLGTHCIWTPNVSTMMRPHTCCQLIRLLEVIVELLARLVLGRLIDDSFPCLLAAHVQYALQPIEVLSLRQMLEFGREALYNPALILTSARHAQREVCLLLL